MGGAVKRFEDLEAWQVARALTNKVYAVTRTEPVRKDFGFVDQIRRAAISVMNNIAEGFERGSNKDFAKFLFISRGSVGEVRSMIYIALDQNYISRETFRECHELCVRSSQLCWGLIRHLQKNSGWKAGISITLMIIASSLSLSLTERL